MNSNPLLDQLDLNRDEFQRIAILCQSQIAKESLAAGEREVAWEILGLCQRAGQMTTQRVPLIQQRDDLQAQLRTAQNQLETLEGEKAKLRDVIASAAKIFREYEQLHRAKGTEEGNQKAGVNGGYAALLETNLR